MPSYKPLNLHPVLPASRKLLKSFEYQVEILVSNGTQNRPESIKQSADKVAGTIVADGRVADEELDLLNRIRQKLQPKEHSSPEATAQLQAERNLYDALEVNYATKSIAARTPDIGVYDLPVKGLLPSSRKMLKAMKEAAGRLTYLNDSTDPAKIDREARKVIAQFTDDEHPSSNKGRFALHIAAAAHNCVVYLKRDPNPDHRFYLDLGVGMEALANRIAELSTFDGSKSISW